MLQPWQLHILSIFKVTFLVQIICEREKKQKKKQLSGFKANYGSLIIAIKLIEYKILMIYAE